MKCSICDDNSYARGLCKKHYMQLMRGKIPGSRTIFDKNEIIEYDDHAEIILYNKYGIETSRILIDLCDVDIASKYKWRKDKDGYAVTSLKNNGRIKNIYLHRILMNPDDGMIVDHINRNKQDCRRNNMRITTNAINSRNTGLQSNNTSGYPGVVWNKNAWNVFITVNGKKIYIGRNKDKNIAIQMRKDAERMYWNKNK